MMSPWMDGPLGSGEQAVVQDDGSFAIERVAPGPAVLMLLMAGGGMDYSGTRNVLQRGPEGFGLLMASVGVGAIGGALTLGALPAPSLRLLFVTAFLSAGGLLVMSVVAGFAAAAVALFALGWVSVIVVTGCNVALQLAAPDELRGRIMSLHTFIYGGVFPFGAFAVGSISERWGVAVAYRAAGIFALAGLVVVLAWWRLRARDA